MTALIKEIDEVIAELEEELKYREMLKKHLLKK